MEPQATRVAVLDAGTAAALWNGCSDQGLPVPNGRYIAEVTALTADGQRARALTQVGINR